MNTDHTPAARRAAPFHRSTHTSTAENIDPATGQRKQQMDTATLTMAWADGPGSELRIRFEAASIAIDVDRALNRARARRGLRGGFDG